MKLFISSHPSGNKSIQYQSGVRQRFKGKAIWITGASSGIGEATSRLLAKEGASLILTSRSLEKLTQLKKECEALGGKAEVLVYDLADMDQLPDLVKQAIGIYGFIDVFFSNAGISQRSMAADTLDTIEDLILMVNYRSAARIAKLLLPSMIAHGGGIIAVNTSITGRFGFPLRSTYSASKHALYGYFESLQAEYFDQKIRVVFVCPGRVKTEISMHALASDGQKHGLLDEGQATGISAEAAAKKIVRAIHLQKSEVLIGGRELLMVYLKRFLPGLARRIIRKIKKT